LLKSQLHFSLTTESAESASESLSGTLQMFSYSFNYNYVIYVEKYLYQKSCF